MNKTRKFIASSAVALLASAGLAACGSDSGGGSGKAASDYLPCMVSDAGGFDDKSFNQLGFEGLKDGAKELGSKYKAVESNTDSDYAPNIDSLVNEGCSSIVTVGFNLAQATKDAAKANPDIEFVLIDDSADGGTDGKTFDGKADVKNIKPLLYDTSQSAFMAGYLAADYSKTGVVGTYGGQPFPTVTIFMDGFKQGVEYYNKTKGKNVKVVGWDGKNGAFTGGFEANNKATETARQILDQNADVILPVGGPIYQGALTAIADGGKPVALVGTDADVFQTDPKTQPIILTSILKNMKVSVKDTIVSAGKGKIDYAPYLGTLKNDGVGLAPFHNFEGKVSKTVGPELDKIKQDIISGKITVKSYLNAS